jgi:hypothetical protein
MAKEAERRAMQLERQRDAELAALETRYAAIAAEKESGELTEEETAHRDMLTEAINKNYDALKQLSDIQATSAAQQEIAGYAKEISDQYKDITRSLAEQDIMRDESLSDYEKEVALNNLARQAALDELKVRFAELEAQREGGALTEEEIALRKELTAAINKNYDEIASGIKKAEINFKDITTQIAQASVSAFTSITSAMSTIAQQQAQEAMAEVDRVLEETTQRIEEQRKAALEAEGFIEAQRAENMQAQIDAAIEANDEVLQYQLERRQREMEINEKYDAQAKEAEEAAKKDKAKLEYDAAKTAWEMDLAAAWASFPLTVMNAIESGWKAGSLIPVPGVAPALAATYAGLAGTAAGVQIAAIQKAEPKLKFADGGIVPGQPHANTDTIAAMLTPGEVILNRAQQETLAPQLESRPLVIQMTLDGRIISEAVINDYVNKGIVLIEARRGIR